MHDTTPKASRSGGKASRHGHLFAAALILTGCSESPAHSDKDYRSAAFAGKAATAYQETYSDDNIVTIDGTLHFRDGDTESVYIALVYDGTVDDPPGSCIFHIDDSGVLESDSDSALAQSDKHILRPCNGSASAQFQIRDASISIKGHPKVDNAGLPEFYIDEIYGPTNLSYYEGHNPSDANSDDDRSGE